jgi:hypothetical protein
VNDLLKGLLPTLATVVGSPVAGLAVKFLLDKVDASQNTIDAVTQSMESMATTPEGRVELAKIDADLRKHLIDQGINLAQLEVANASDINRTMQAEAAAEHWPTYTWRPAIGYAVALNIVLSSVTVLAVYVAVVVGWAHAGEALTALPAVLGALAAINGVAMPILGIASYFRGQMQANPDITTIQVPFGRKK